MKTAEFGQPVARVPQPGTCRICGCTEDHACVLLHLPTDSSLTGMRTCGWADQTKTLCDNPPCIAEAKRELGFGATPDECRICGRRHSPALTCEPRHEREERFLNRVEPTMRSERCTGCGVSDGHLHSGSCTQSRGPTSFFHAGRS